MRLFLIVLGLAIFFSFPALVCVGMDDWPSDRAATETLRKHGAWAWLAGAGLIISDLLLPVPATAVMAALGFLYGPLIGGLVGASASFAAGVLAYGATRLLGHRAAVFLAGERDMERAESFFRRAGGFAVAFSRPLPILPEVVACLAGMARMRPATFLVSLACGCVPTGFIFAGAGSMAEDSPRLALVLAAAIPILLWLPMRRLLAQRSTPESSDA